MKNDIQPAITIPAGTFPVLSTTGAVHDKWVQIGNGRREPAPWDHALRRVVEMALDNGLFYNADVFEFVLKHIPVTESDLLIEKSRVERGSFGMEVYYCRKASETAREKAARIEAAKGFSLGQVIKAVLVGGHRLSTVTLTSISADGFLAFAAKKRGSPREWNGTCSASSMAQAMKSA